MTLVIDASMAIAWLFQDERSQVPETVLLRVVEEGAVVPSLWKLEVANALQTAVRRGRCEDAYAVISLERLERLRIAIDDRTDEHAWGRTRDLAIDYSLTLYDAAYLELAIRREAVLATRDSALVMAAKRADLQVLYD